MKQNYYWLLKQFAPVAITLAVMLAVFLASCSPLNPRRSYSGKVKTVTISEGFNETRTLIYVAEERGLFAANGINVIYKEYISGAAAASALVKGEVDLAAGAEFVIAGNVLRKENIRSIASIDKFQNTYIIGRTDKGIKGIADLKGKRIGVPRQTSPEFFLGRFLDLNGMSIRDVTPVDATPAQAVDALVNGSIDAVAIFEPQANMIIRKLGDSVIVWPAQGGQLTYFNLFGTAPWVESNPQVITRLLRSLVQAENYMANHTDEVKAVVQKRLKYDDAYINAIWSEHQFTVSLDQSLILAMEDQARWMINNNLTTEKQVPDFPKYIYTDGLKTVKPGAVNIIK